MRRWSWGVCCAVPATRRMAVPSENPPKPTSADPGLAVEIDLQEQVRARRREVAWLLVSHPRGEGAHGEADGLEHVEQQSVLLEAVAAAATAHQFVDERVMRQFDGPAEQDVEILERDRVDVTSRDGMQDLQRRHRGTAVADAGEVAGRAIRSAQSSPARTYRGRLGSKRVAHVASAFRFAKATADSRRSSRLSGARRVSPR